MANKQQNRPSTASKAGKHSQQRHEARQNRPNSLQSQRNRRKRVAPNRTRWLLLGGSLVLIVAIVVFFVYLSNQSSSTGSSNSAGNVDANTFKQVTGVDSALLSTIGTGGVTNPFSTVSNSSTILTGPTGKPEVFYYGAEFCPNCAAERWSVVVAMSRFGTFQSLKGSASASNDTYPSTATFTFYQIKYSSSYIDFVALENEDQQHNVIQTPTTDQQQLLTRFSVTGYPFMSIGDRYLIKGASFDPTILRTNTQDQNSAPLTIQDIATELSSGNQLSKDILGTANYLTAATCAITNNQPASACSDTAIQTIETALTSGKQSRVNTGSSPLAATVESPAADISRRWKL